jgi:hypothetical protein
MALKSDIKYQWMKWLAQDIVTIELVTIMRSIVDLQGGSDIRM